MNTRKQYGKPRYFKTNPIVKLQKITTKGNTVKQASRDGFASENLFQKFVSVRNEPLKKITV